MDVILFFRNDEQVLGELPLEALSQTNHRRILSDPPQIDFDIKKHLRPVSFVSTTSTFSNQSMYRSSIASISHLAENEPESLLKLANLYYDPKEDGNPFGDRNRVRYEKVSGSERKREKERERERDESYRANIKRATKLANFFGTTRGDVLKQ
jgi:hypothetical protein